MKFESQSRASSTQSHLAAEPHSSQGNNNQDIVVGGSPGEVVGVDTMLLSPWAANTEFLEAHDAKQTTPGLEETWDTMLLGTTVGVGSATQSLAELKPLPPFAGYTGHLSINGIQGHHYHTIASSAQRPAMGSTSPTQSTNQEYYESSVVSSSTPCPQVSTPISQNQDGVVVTPRDWMDIADWIDSACSPKSQETNSSSPYSHMFQAQQQQQQQQQPVQANPVSLSQQPPAPHGSTLQSLLTHGYSPMLQQRLQATCGETPSSTSPYPVSPPGRVSTSCSPEHQLHSSFAPPQHPRKRSRPSGGSHNSSKKSLTSSNAAATTTLPYGTESGLVGGKEKPIHRCSICNRGFLNKSNIKVHLRTHTGEKPFKCDICSKAFRQKAHLIKHQQIHKRIGRE